MEPSPTTGEVQSPAAVTLSAEATPARVREQQLRYVSQSSSSSQSSRHSSSSSSYGDNGSGFSSGSSPSYGGGGPSSSPSSSSSPYERIQQQRLPLRSGTKY